MINEPKITEEQPVPGVTNAQVQKKPAENGQQRPQPEKESDREGQTREPGYDEA